MGLLMLFVVEPIMGGINTALNNGLTSMGSSSKIILGLILGGMMAINPARTGSIKPNATSPICLNIAAAGVIDTRGISCDH